MLGYTCRLSQLSCCFLTSFLFNSFQSGFEPTTSLKLFLLLVLTLTNLTSLIFLNIQFLIQLNNLFLLKPRLPLAFRAQHLPRFPPTHLPLFRNLSMWKHVRSSLPLRCFYFSTQVLGFLLKAHGFKYVGLSTSFHLYIYVCLTYPLVGKSSKIELLLIPHNQLIPRTSPSPYIQLYRPESQYSFLILPFPSLSSANLLASSVILVFKCIPTCLLFPISFTTYHHHP